MPLTYTAREQDDDPTVPRARNFGARTTVSGCITRSNGLDVDAHVYPNLVNWGKWNTLQFTSSMEFGEMASAAPHGHVHFAFDIRISDLSTETRKRALNIIKVRIVRAANIPTNANYSTTVSFLKTNT